MDNDDALPRLELDPRDDLLEELDKSLDFFLPPFRLLDFFASLGALRFSLFLFLFSFFFFFFHCCVTQLAPLAIDFSYDSPYRMRQATFSRPLRLLQTIS